MNAHLLMQAAEIGNTDAVRTLLDKGVSADVCLSDGETALIRAASSGQTEAVRLLLDRGAQINARRGDGMTALIRAAFFGHSEVISLLLNKGADVTAKDRFGQTALGWASSRGHAKVVRLLTSGAPANAAAERIDPPILKPDEQAISAVGEAPQPPPIIAAAAPETAEIQPTADEAAAAAVVAVTAEETATAPLNLTAAADEVTIVPVKRPASRTSISPLPPSPPPPLVIKADRKQYVVAEAIDEPDPFSPAVVPATILHADSGARPLAEPAAGKNLRRVTAVAFVIFFICTALVYVFTQSRNQPARQSQAEDNQLKPLVVDSDANPVEPIAAAPSEQVSESEQSDTGETTPLPVAIPEAASDRSSSSNSSDAAVVPERKAESGVKPVPTADSSAKARSDAKRVEVVSTGANRTERAKQDEKPRPTPRPTPPAARANEARDAAAAAPPPPRIVVPRRDTAMPPPTASAPPAASSNPSPTPKKKVIQWP